MKILNSKQIREADQFTIENEPISSIELMERASQAFVNKFLGLHPKKQRVYAFCGTGNNGGDGLAISRLLIDRGWEVEVYVIGEVESGSNDFKNNLDRVSRFHEIKSNRDFPSIAPDSILVDGLFGSGLSRPIEGLYGEIIQFLNKQQAQRIAIDIASGLFADEPISEEENVFHADYTISFQLPKLVFFLPTYEKYVGEWRVVNISLDQSFIRNQPTHFHLTTVDNVRNLIPSRSTFTHKSSVGKLMIVAGSKGKMGAATLCARGAFKSGVGLIHVHAPSCGTDILQVSVPEAMVSVDDGESFTIDIPTTDDVIVIGPGLGTQKETVAAFEKLLTRAEKPLVIDADGINMLSEHNRLIPLVPKDSILTPHPGEFKRLVGEWSDDFEKLEKLRTFCQEFQLNMVLKGAYSAVCNTQGEVFFNPTGNPGLATAGSGDVLTGIIGALLSQGLHPFDALKLGVYLHGLSGDEAIRQLQTPWIQASDIIDFIPNAVSSLIGS